MKNTTSSLLLTLVLLLTLSVSQSFPENPAAGFHYNPMLLNGKSMDITRLSTASRGKLSVEDYESAQITTVPFYIYLVRAGKIVDVDVHKRDHAVLEIELSDILKSAKPGDQLFIDLAGKNQKTARRIIRIKQDPILPRFNWLYGVIKSKEGC